MTLRASTSHAVAKSYLGDKFRRRKDDTRTSASILFIICGIVVRIPHKFFAGSNKAVRQLEEKSEFIYFILKKYAKDLRPQPNHLQPQYTL